jgi:SOS-response transcriptional repressor LexA
MPKPMTAKQSKIYDFILIFLGREKTTPTFSEINKEFKFSSPNSANVHIKALIKKGWLEKRSDKSIRNNYKPIHIELTITRTEEEQDGTTGNYPPNPISYEAIRHWNRSKEQRKRYSKRSCKRSKEINGQD